MLIDEIEPSASSRPGAHAVEVWTTDGFPWTMTVRKTRVSARPAPRSVVMSGEIDMDLDGAVIDLKVGDVPVQRGTFITGAQAACILGLTDLFDVASKGHLGEGGTSARPLLRVVGENRAQELIVVAFLCLRQAYLHLVA